MVFFPFVSKEFFFSFAGFIFSKNSFNNNVPKDQRNKKKKKKQHNTAPTKWIFVGTTPEEMWIFVFAFLDSYFFSLFIFTWFFSCSLYFSWPGHLLFVS